MSSDQIFGIYPLFYSAFLCALTKYLIIFKISFCIYEYLEIFNLKKNFEESVGKQLLTYYRKNKSLGSA